MRGLTPARRRNRGRCVEHAQELLETTDLGIEMIARRGGFASATTFRTWPALMALPWMPVYEVTDQARPPIALAPCWVMRDQRDESGAALVWDLWHEPVAARAPNAPASR